MRPVYIIGRILTRPTRQSGAAWFAHIHVIVWFHHRIDPSVRSFLGLLILDDNQDAPHVRGRLGIGKAPQSNLDVRL